MNWIKVENSLPVEPKSYLVYYQQTKRRDGRRFKFNPYYKEFRVVKWDGKKFGKNKFGTIEITQYCAIERPNEI
jgi:hypothetical protein